MLGLLMSMKSENAVPNPSVEVEGGAGHPANPNGQVVLTQEAYATLMKAATTKKKIAVSGSRAPFPAEASRNGNYYYLLLDGMVNSSDQKAVIVHGWKAAEKQFAAGKTWEDGKTSRGHMVQGFKTSDEAHAAFVEAYPDRWVVPLRR